MRKITTAAIQIKAPTIITVTYITTEILHHGTTTVSVVGVTITTGEITSHQCGEWVWALHTWALAGTHGTAGAWEWVMVWGTDGTHIIHGDYTVVSDMGIVVGTLHTTIHIGVVITGVVETIPATEAAMVLFMALGAA